MDYNVDPWGDQEEWDQEGYDLADSDGYDDYDEE
jgi:hypothetical protein